MPHVHRRLRPAPGAGDPTRSALPQIRPDARTRRTALHRPGGKTSLVRVTSDVRLKRFAGDPLLGQGPPTPLAKRGSNAWLPERATDAYALIATVRFRESRVQASGECLRIAPETIAGWRSSEGPSLRRPHGAMRPIREQSACAVAEYGKKGHVKQIALAASIAAQSPRFLPLSLSNQRAGNPLSPFDP